jgi:HD-GYP domain-containing protein (c-di-GMP phosphodiesterase class II)
MTDAASSFVRGRPTQLRGTMTSWPVTTALGEAEIERSRARLVAAPAPAELRTGTALLAAFAAGAVALGAPTGSGWVWMLAVLAALYALAGLVEFEVGPVYTDCSLPVLAAMLIALPAQIVPWCVAAGVALGGLVKSLRGARHPARLVPAVAQVSLPALAPAAVLTVWSGAPAVAAALLAYIVADLVVSVAFARFAYGAALAIPSREELGVYGVDLLLAPVGVAMAVAADGRAWVVAAVFLPLVALLRVFAHERRSRVDQALDLSRAYRGTAMLLGDLVETDDAYTGSHSRDVVELAVEVGRRMGLGREALRDLEFGALLHDVGKIAVPNEILNKPGRLDAKEWAIMKRHTIEGQRMLEHVGGVLARVGMIVRASHESFDGSGYPDGLAGYAIPIEARICAACDAFSAMTTDRAYRSAMPFDEAIAELRRCSGTQFDPEVVVTLVEVLEEGSVTRVETAAPAPVPV